MRPLPPGPTGPALERGDLDGRDLLEVGGGGKEERGSATHARGPRAVGREHDHGKGADLNAVGIVELCEEDGDHHPVPGLNDKLNCREAADDAQCSGVVHIFSGDLEDVKVALEHFPVNLLENGVIDGLICGSERHHKQQKQVEQLHDVQCALQKRDKKEKGK